MGKPGFPIPLPVGAASPPKNKYFHSGVVRRSPGPPRRPANRSCTNALIRLYYQRCKCQQLCWLYGVHQICGKGGEQAIDERAYSGTGRYPAPATAPGPLRWPRPSNDRAMRVERREGETVEQLIRRFNKGVISERITKTYREKMHFISKSEQRKEKRRRAERNRRKKMAKGY